MATREIMAGIYADDAMLPDTVRVEGAGALPLLFMAGETFDRLVNEASLGGVCDVMESRPAGTYPLPSRLVDPAVTREVEMALAFVEPVESTVCVLPGCSQPVVSTTRGFALCLDHSTSLQGWDDLVA